MLQQLALIAAGAFTAYLFPMSLLPTAAAAIPESRAYEVLCVGCKNDFVIQPFQGGNCFVNFHVVGQDGLCVGNRPECSVTRFCWFVTQPLCDNTCCLPAFQDWVGNWNVVLCGQNTGIWTHPCQYLATAVLWRVTDYCANPPVSNYGGVVYYCSQCL